LFGVETIDAVLRSSRGEPGDYSRRHVVGKRRAAALIAARAISIAAAVDPCAREWRPQVTMVPEVGALHSAFAAILVTPSKGD